MAGNFCRKALIACVLSVVGLFFGIAEARQDKAGRYDYLSLVLSWSPTYCAGPGRRSKEIQCAGERPYAFVLHGLWPQYNRGFPQYCRVQWRPWVPKSVISGMLDIMPSKKLVIHEYKKHGTCMGVDATKYYRASRLLFDAVKIPVKYKAPEKPFVTNIRDVRQAFVKANPTLKPNMFAVVCGKRDRLKEVRICFDRKGKFTRCGVNENQSRLCRTRKIRVPAVRVGRKNLQRPGRPSFQQRQIRSGQPDVLEQKSRPVRTGPVKY